MSSYEVSPNMRGVPGLVAVVIATGLMAFTFVVGIDVAMGLGSALAYEIIFLACAVIVLVCLVWAIVNLVRWRSPVIAGLTILIALIPVIAVVWLRMAAVG